MLILQNGIVIGCERNGHSTIYCDDCEMVDSVNCPAYKLPEKPYVEPDYSNLVKKPIISNLGINVNARSKSIYETIAEEIAKLVEIKQQKYGDSFGNSYKILEVLYPKGIQPKDYQDLLTVVRVIDKLFRITKGDQGDESAWKDINGYSLLSLVRDSRKGETL